MSQGHKHADHCHQLLRRRTKLPYDNKERTKLPPFNLFHHFFSTVSAVAKDTTAPPVDVCQCKPGFGWVASNSHCSQESQGAAVSTQMAAFASAEKRAREESLEADEEAARSHACMHALTSLVWAEDLHDIWVAFDFGAADEVDAVGDGGKDGVEAGSDGGGLARERDHEGLVAHAGGLAREDGRRHALGQRRRAHRLPEPGQELAADALDRLRRHVARRRARPARGNHQGAALLPREPLDLLLNQLLFIRDALELEVALRPDVLLEHGEHARAGL
eukprot:CAMPEP_0197491768 /NCGR_PEP_ID=MMETSP1311-20131121/5930_1 /TAXON_ID=464262 /ORGANISM="Genus nov. species nov., Strain RCC856" /LENGTH=275 /DNA_ID=CAMNT_0043036473 /DNA_START=184 /DNA_END=1009 /DNA_ORIENTATION=-